MWQQQALTPATSGAGCHFGANAKKLISIFISGENTGEALTPDPDTIEGEDESDRNRKDWEEARAASSAASINEEDVFGFGEMGFDEGE